MTEHQNIPLPDGDSDRKLSLLERAELAFGTDGIKPAAVPRDLAPPVNRQVQKDRRANTAPDRRAVSMQADSPTARREAASPASSPALPPVRFNRPAQKIDRARLAHFGLIDPEKPASGLMEEFRIVKRNLLQAARDAFARGEGAKAQRVLVTSPLPGEGKTFTATNIALALAAEKDLEVVLVDADFAKPSLLSVFDLPRGKGLMDALANPSIKVEDCVIPTDIGGLHVLPAGLQTISDSEFLASSSTEAVLDRLTQGVDRRIVVFDTSPALAASHTAELAKYIGQSIVVARADQTGQSALEDTLSLLSSCRDLKLLLNAAHFSPSGRRFGSYRE